MVWVPVSTDFLRLVCVWELFESDSSNEKKKCDLPGLISLFITYSLKKLPDGHFCSGGDFCFEVLSRSGNSLSSSVTE